MSSAITTAGTRPRDGAVAVGPRASALVPASGAGIVDVDVSALLTEGARLARETVGADCAAVLLRDPADLLVPVAWTSPADDLLGAGRFRALPPVPVAILPSEAARPILVNDADSSSLVPDEWRTAFGVKSAAITPLVVDGVLRGALAVAYRRVPHEFSDNEVRALEAAAATLRYVLGVADAAEPARRRALLVDRLGAVGRELCAARSRPAVLQTGLAAVAEILGGSAGAVHVVRGDDVDTLATRGAGQPDPGSRPVAEADAVTRQAVRAVAAGAAVVLPGGAVAVPMGGAAVLVVAGARTTMPADLDAARVVAGQTGLAYERAAEVADATARAALLDALCAVAADPLAEPDLGALLERLAAAVRAATGAELLDAFLSDAALARALAAPGPDRKLAALLRRWRRAPGAEPATLDDLLVLPLTAEGTLLGALRVRPGDRPGPDAAALLRTVATALAGAVARVAARARLAEQERLLAVAAERERVNADVHDALGQQLFALRVELDGLAAAVSERSVAARLRGAVTVVTDANADLRVAVHTLSHLGHTKRGLVPALRALVRTLGETTRIGLSVRVVGTPVPLGAGCEVALFRVAHEALANVVRHSRASTATVTVSYSPERVSVIVRDDGTGMSARSDEQRGLHFGVRMLQRRMAELGGGLDVSNFRPHGVCLHAWVPAP